VTSTLLWKPLLACSLPVDFITGDFQWDAVPYPVYASYKYDGYRAMVQRGVLVSRNGLAVKNEQLQKRYGHHFYEGLDGELVDGSPTAANAFHRTSSVVKKASADASTTRFYLIDRRDASTDPFSTRLSSFLEAMDPDPWHFRVIKHHLIRTPAQLKSFMERAEAAGWEGIMLRRANQGAYPQKQGKENRSTLREFNLVRVKRFEFGEATIQAIHPLRHNTNTEKTNAGKRSTRKAGIITDARLIGSATLRNVLTGVEFDTNVNGDALRAWPGWQTKKNWFGKVVRYKWQVCGTKDKPRINTCTFEELREEGK
jgi:DNA ligase 1